MICSICFNDIPVVGGWTDGNNADPVNAGRCCDDCDNNVVIPARLTMMARKLSAETYTAMRREQFEALRQQFEPVPTIKSDAHVCR